MTNQTDQLGCFAVCVTEETPQNTACIGRFEAEPGSIVDGDTLRILIGCDHLECVTWRTSNVDHGLIWMDEHGLLKDLLPTAVLKDSYGPSFALQGQLAGSLVFTGPTDETGDAQWLSKKQAIELHDHLLGRKTLFVNDISFLELTGIIQKTA